MNAPGIDKAIEQWAKMHGCVVAAEIRRRLIEEFDLDTEMECWAILDTLQQVAPDQFAHRGITKSDE